MADKPITQDASLPAVDIATDDLIPVVDISEAAAADKNKNITFNILTTYLTTELGIVDWKAGTESGFHSLGIDDNATAERLELADNYLAIGGTQQIFSIIRNGAGSEIGQLNISANSSVAAAGFKLYAASHATQADDWEYQVDSVVEFHYDHSAGEFDFISNHIRTTGTFYVNGVLDLANATIPTVAVTGSDMVLIRDDSDNQNLKEVTAQSIADLASVGSADNIVIDVRKNSVGTITKGIPVYLVGYNVAGYYTIEAADADDPNTMPAIGIAGQDITNSATVSLVVFGSLTSMDTSAFNTGDPLYVSDTSGLTTTRPANADDGVQKLGIVTRSHVNDGVIMVAGAFRTNDQPNVHPDDVFRIVDSSDNTKILQFEISGVSTGTVRTITVPDNDLTLPSEFFGKQTLWIPAKAMEGATTNGPEEATRETTAGRPDIISLDFDALTEEHAHFQMGFPKQWNEGTVTFQVYWSSLATDTDGVAWGLKAVAVSDGDTIDVAFGTGVVVTDNAQGTAEDLYITVESAAVTIAGTPAEGDGVFFDLYREVGNASDTMGENAKLIGIKLHWTNNALTDA